MRLKFTSTYFGWIASLFLICFSIVFTFNPAQVESFLTIPPISYSFIIGIILLINGAVAYYYHFQKILDHRYRRFLWVPATIIFYYLSFYSSGVVVDSIASYMFFALGSLYFSLIIFNCFDFVFEKTNRQFDLGLYFVLACAAVFGLIAFLDTARYVHVSPSYIIIFKIFSLCLMIFPLLSIVTRLIFNKTWHFLNIISGVFMTLLFISIALDKSSTQAVLPFLVWVPMFFYHPNKYETFNSKTGSISRQIMNYTAVIAMIPLLSALILVTQVSLTHQREMAQSSLQNFVILTNRYLEEHADIHRYSARSVTATLAENELSQANFEKGVHNITGEEAEHVKGNAIVDITGKIILTDTTVSAEVIDFLLSNTDKEFQLVYMNNEINLFQRFTNLDQNDYFFYQKITFGKHLKELLAELKGSDIDSFVINTTYDVVNTNSNKAQILSDTAIDISKDISFSKAKPVSENNKVFYSSFLVKDLSGLTFVLVSSKSFIVNQMNLLKDLMIYVLIAAYGITILLAYLFSRSIINPIVNLTSSIDVRKMKFDMKTLNQYVKRTDEIGVLAENFYELYYRVFDAMKETKGLYKEETEWANTLKTEIEKMEAIFASIGDGIFVLENNGMVKKFNEAALGLTGKHADEILGKRVFEIFNFIDEKSGKKVDICEHVVKNDKARTGLDVIMTDLAGLSLPISFVTTPIHDYSGKVIGCIFVFHDYSQEAELDKAKSEFVSVAAHQLRAPLTAIKLSAEMLKEQFAKTMTKEQKEIIDILVGANERLILLVNDLLNVSRIESKRMQNKPEPIDLSTLVDEIVKEIKIKSVEKNQKLILNLDEGTKIFADKSQIRESAQNFIENAIKYTPEEGSVTVTVKKDQKTVVFEVRDTGIGIPLAQQSNLFAKFFRADNARASESEGTGLGLYIAKHAVETAKGKVTVKSEENKGTTFTITLPLTTKKTAKAKVK